MVMVLWASNEESRAVWRDESATQDVGPMDTGRGQMLYKLVCVEKSRKKEAVRELIYAASRRMGSVMSVVNTPNQIGAQCRAKSAEFY